MTSTRLPGKILKQVCGRTLLDYHVSRLLKSQYIDRLVIATTVNATDDPIEQYCTAKNIDCVRGDEADVLARYYQAAQEYSVASSANIIVRVTSDCPLIDPDLLDQLVRYYISHRDQYDYVALGDDHFPRGLDVEVFSAEALAKAHTHGQLPLQREHVTPYIYRDGSEFRCGILPSDEKYGHHRWCVDEPADLLLITNILEAFEGRDDFSWAECCRLFDENPHWLALNDKIRQKTLEQ